MLKETDERRSRTKTLLIMKVAAGFLLLLLLGLVYHLQQIPEPLSEIQLVEFQVPTPPYRKPAPAIEWLDGSGKVKSLKDYAGKVAVATFWAHWCAPCLKEIPTLNQLFMNLSDPDLEVIGINTDTDDTEIKSALDFWQAESISFGNTFMSKSSAKPEQLPTTYVIDRDGQVVFETHEALNWASPQAEGFLRKLLSNHESEIGDTPDTE